MLLVSEVPWDQRGSREAEVLLGLQDLWGRLGSRESKGLTVARVSPGWQVFLARLEVLETEVHLGISVRS